MQFSTEYQPSINKLLYSSFPTQTMKCQECDGTVFIPGTKFLKISKMITGTPQDAIIPVELYLCGDCGEINKELLPKELQNNG